MRRRTSAPALGSVLLCASASLWLADASAAPGDILFNDNFERATLGPNWTSSNPAITGIGTQTANSPTRSAFTSNTAVSLTSLTIPLTVPGAEVNLWIRRGDDAFSEDPDGSENLVVEYQRNDGVFVTLGTFSGAGTAGEIFQPTFALPQNALHAGFQLRLRQTDGSGTGFDFWHIDDVVIRELPPDSGAPDLMVGTCDDFENGLVNFSVNASGGNAGVSTATSASPVTSAFTNAGPVTLISRVIDTSFGLTGVSFFIQRGSDAFSENPDGTENLEVSYIDDNGNPVVLETFTGSGTPGQTFVRNFDLSAQSDAQHPNFQIQFRQTAGSGASFDFWHIDDVCILGALTADIAITSTVTSETDPVSGAANPKAIPQATLLYRVETTNQGPAVLDSNSLQLRFEIPADTSLFVGDLDGLGSPLRFFDGSDPSGLAFSFVSLGDAGDDVVFLDAGDNPVIPDASGGFDPAVRAMVISLNGTFNAASATSSPSFVFEYRLRVE